MGWGELLELWSRVRLGPERKLAGWSDTRLLRYIILRAFQLDEAKVTWPYSVVGYGGLVRESHGVVTEGNLTSVIYTVDDVGPTGPSSILKARQLIPEKSPRIIANIFTCGTFTASARTLARFELSSVILLWGKSEIEFALERRSIVDVLKWKYRVFTLLGMPDYDCRAGEPF